MPLVVPTGKSRRVSRYCTADFPCKQSEGRVPCCTALGPASGPMLALLPCRASQGSRCFWKQWECWSCILQEARSVTFRVLHACAASHACQSFAVAGVPGNAWCYDLGTEAACAWLTQRRARRQRVLRAAGILWVRTAPCPGRRDSLNALPSFHRLCKATVRGDRAWCGL